MDETTVLRTRIGERLRALRQERRRSLREVASSVGCSATALSYIENGRNGASVDLLARLVDEYAVSIDSVLTGASEGTEVDGVHTAAPVGFVQSVLPPGASTRIASRYVPGSVDVVFVVEGVLTLRIGHEVCTLTEGSSVQFPTDRPQEMLNQTEAPVMVLRGRVARSAAGRTRAAI